MRILVDGDACPGKNFIEEAAKKYELEMIIYCDMNHVITSAYSKVCYVESGFQNVDMVIANETKPGDLVVTQDFGVAAMVLGKKAYAVNPKGLIYTEGNIDGLLLERHISQKLRKAGKKTTNAKKRTTQDDERLYSSLIKIITEAN
ncbi:MAG TPA: YaiI/YqxD family protein [Clostridiaceae bacterium]